MMRWLAQTTEVVAIQVATSFCLCSMATRGITECTFDGHRLSFSIASDSGRKIGRNAWSYVLYILCIIFYIRVLVFRTSLQGQNSFSCLGEFSSL